MEEDMNLDEKLLVPNANVVPVKRKRGRPPKGSKKRGRPAGSNKKGTITDMRYDMTKGEAIEIENAAAETRKKVNSKVAKFMKAAREFAKKKAGADEVPAEWEISLLMLEVYFKEFLELSERIDSLPSLTVVGRYGETPHPMLAVRDKAAMRLEALLKQTGLTIMSAKSVMQMGEKEEVKQSALDKFLAGATEDDGEEEY